MARVIEHAWESLLNTLRLYVEAHMDFDALDEVAAAQRLVLEAGHVGTEIALIRLQFEATVRAAWNFT